MGDPTTDNYIVENPRCCFDEGKPEVTAFNWQSGGDCRLGCNDTRTDALHVGQVPAVAFQQNQLGELRCGEKVGTLNTNSNASGRNTPMVAMPGLVRRLTPIECERLQGFPDGYTAGFSDSARYRMLGNAVAVPVVSWIIARIPS